MSGSESEQEVCDTKIECDVTNFWDLLEPSMISFDPKNIFSDVTEDHQHPHTADGHHHGDGTGHHGNDLVAAEKESTDGNSIQDVLKIIQAQLVGWK